MELLRQINRPGNRNGCGTTALAMALNSLTGQARYSQMMLDTSARYWDSFSAPQMLCRLARQAGFEAVPQNCLTPDAIRRHLAQGHRLILLEQPDRNAANYHYVFLYGMSDDADPQLDIACPVDGHRRIAYLTYCKTRWGQLHLGPLPLGLDRFGIVLSGKADLPQPTPLPWALLLADAVSRTLTAAGRFTERLGLRG